MSSEIKYLLPHRNFYKANLNCHSTLSDGAMTPEQLKELYKSNGYSVLAMTDKKAQNESALCDADFLALSGFCFGAEKNEGVPHKSSVFTAISLSEEPLSIGEFCGEYGSADVPAYISECKNRGYFTTYCHPARSCEVMPEYLTYSEVDAMEIINYSSLMEGYDEYNGVCYDNFLRRDHRLFCTASDGNKNLRPLDSARSDSFGAFTYINSDSLNYESIANSLKNGEFYASEGPEIRGLWVKGDMLNIRTSPVDKIIVSSGRRGAKSFYANGRVPLTAASFQLGPKDVYVRCIIIDEDGKRAYTRAYYLDEIL